MNDSPVLLCSSHALPLRTQSREASRSCGNKGARRLLMILILAFLLRLSPSDPVLAAEAQAPLELLPYHVRLLVAFDAPNHSATSLDDIVKETRRMSERCIGPIWQLTADEIDWLQPASSQGLGRLSLSDVLSHFAEDEKPYDVWFVATVQNVGAGWRVDVRSWQPELHLESEPIGQDVADLRDLPLTVVKLCHTAYSPIGRVEDVDGKTARIIVQGSALLAPDESLSLAKTVKTFSPILAHRNRERKVEKVMPIPWTYLAVTDSSQLRWTCEILSGLKNPIGGKQRGRVETMVVAVRSTFSSTRLELATQGKPSLPVIAHRIEVRDGPEIPKQDEVTETDEHLLRLLVTDRRGLISIASPLELPVVWLFAYSGRHLLARVPFVPGSVRNARLEVPDDATRLEAESELQVLQGRLIEAVAARNTVFARVRNKIKKNELSTDESEEKELREIPDSSVHLERLSAVRVSAVNAAKARKDRASEARINRMCNETAELIQQYLNEDKRQQLLEELKELRADNKAMHDEENKPKPKKKKS